VTGGVVERVRARLAGGPVDPRHVADLVRDEAPLWPDREVAAAVASVVAAVEGLGVLEPLLADVAVSDVLVVGGRPVWVERDGRLEPTQVVVPSAEVERLIERIVAPLGLRADRASPLVDARLPDGSRVHAVVPPLAVDGPCLTILRFATRTLPLTTFAPAPVADLLGDAVRRGANLVVAGGTGAGKTTLLNALAAEIPPGQRIITVEDAAELRLPQDHVVRLESRPANAEGIGHVPVRELVRNALRMRPDRIVVGECRGAEAFDMLQGMNTGHDGSMTTCHANAVDDALRRLETMVLLADVGLPLPAVREQLASALDVVIQVTRAAGGRRRVTAVAAVVSGERRVRPLIDGDRVVARPEGPKWA
jgi:pilus assembly protein CpaF